MLGYDENQTRSSGIEWTSHTWNPFVGCSIKSAGCVNCYAMALAERLQKMGQDAYRGTTETTKTGKTVWTGRINQSKLDKPAKIKQPSVIFVNSMSDFFHENATDLMRMSALSVMERENRHQYQILTKRPENIAKFMQNMGISAFPDNIWIGATVESGLVKSRIDEIRRIPAKIKFLSIEPLIQPIGEADFSGIDWVISGGESGPNSRQMKVEWVAEVHEMAKKHGVRHFFKQYGLPQNNPLWNEALKLGEHPARYVSQNDPIGKGGSKLFGEYVKEFPANFSVANYQ
jgi:protein gp37